MTEAYVGGGIFSSYNKQSEACTSWSQNGCPSSRQYICIQAKTKEQKAQQFLYPFIRSTKTFPGSCLLLSLPTSFLPPRGLLLLKSYWSELGYLATSSYKGHWEKYSNWPRPVRIQGLSMLLPIYEGNQSSASKEEGSDGK